MTFVCAACGKKFGGLTGFDAHRVGRLVDTPPHYGRRCLDAVALRGRGYSIDTRGLWVRPSSDGKRPWRARVDVEEASAPAGEDVS